MLINALEPRRQPDTATEMPQAEVSLTDMVHQLNAGDRDRRIAKRLGFQASQKCAARPPMIMLNQVIEIFEIRPKSVG